MNSEVEQRGQEERIYTKDTSWLIRYPIFTKTIDSCNKMTNDCYKTKC